MMKKLLIASTLLGSVATMNTYVGVGGMGAIGFSPSFATTKNLFNNVVGGASFGSSDYFEVAGTPATNDVTLTSKSSKLGFYQLNAFVTVAFLMDNILPSMSFGLMADIGYRYMPLANPTWSTDPNSGSVFSMTPNFNNLFAVPKLAIGMDTSLCHVLFTLGLDISRAQYDFDVTTGNPTQFAWKQMTWGLAFGLEGIFQIAPCVGVGVGVVYTYWPQFMNSLYGNKDSSTGSDTSQAFGNASINKDDVAINASWHSVALKLAVYLSL